MRWLAVAVCSASCGLLLAQETATDRVEPATMTIGPGIGLDFGGLGVQVSGRPLPALNLLLGVGYNLNGAGINAGAAWRMLPKKRFCPYLVGLYGYNAVISIRNDEGYTRTYYGPSAGVGIEIHPRRRSGHLQLAVYLPFRSAEFTDDLERVKADPVVDLRAEPLPVAFSLGYHFGL
ncbi:MAG: hypothetical protein IT227_12690 [Flavobacteriales bacterium]|nr:hypothetical protein [Flavobacteriales bacterium]